MAVSMMDVRYTAGVVSRISEADASLIDIHPFIKEGYTISIITFLLKFQANLCVPCNLFLLFQKMAQVNLVSVVGKGVHKTVQQL